MALIYTAIAGIPLVLLFVHMLVVLGRPAPTHAGAPAHAASSGD